MFRRSPTKPGIKRFFAYLSMCNKLFINFRRKSRHDVQLIITESSVWHSTIYPMLCAKFVKRHVNIDIIGWLDLLPSWITLSVVLPSLLGHLRNKFVWLSETRVLGQESILLDSRWLQTIIPVNINIVFK